MRLLLLSGVFLLVRASFGGAVTHASAASDRLTVSGFVRDAATGDTLAAGTIRVAGSPIGTVLNERGRFILSLPPGRYSLVISALGYQPDTLAVVLDSNRSLAVSLEPAEIVLPEIVVTSEDPALAIMRRVIAEKRKWIERLNSYRLDAFTRQLLSRDTSIASITESYTTGYWEKGDTLREIIRQRRQTENIPSQFNFASVGRLLNFNEDRLRFLGYTFVGPTAEDAFDYYTYKLLGTRTTSGREFFEIQVIPLTRTSPLFGGTIMIAGGTYALMGVNVEPNDAFLIPFVKRRTLRYRQEFSQYEGGFWMPIDIRIDGSFDINFPAVTFPRFGFTQTSVVYSYELNVPIPDSVRVKPRLSVDSSVAVFDSTLWAETKVLPLTPVEEQAYATLDSTKTLDVQFRPGGLAMTLSAGGESSPLLEYLDLSYNRVEGFHAGVQYQSGSAIPWLEIRGNAAYGFSRKRAIWGVGATVYTSGERTLGFGADAYSKVAHRPDQDYYGPLYNSLTGVLVANDYRDYYSADGGRVFVAATPLKWLRAEAGYVNELQRSLPQTEDFAIFVDGSTFRDNPPVAEGRLQAGTLRLSLGPTPVPFDLVWTDRVDVDMEWGGGDLSYGRYAVVGSLQIPTIGGDFLLKPSLRMRLAAGAHAGSLPPQRTFDLESQSSGFGPFGVLRGLHVKEYNGSDYVAVSLEHNFRTLPFLWLGIPFLYDNGIEFLVHGGVARTWAKDPGLAFYPPPPGPEGPIPPPTPIYRLTDGLYGEIGFGFGRIFQIIRTDLTWRISAPRRLMFTLGVSGIL